MIDPTSEPGSGSPFPASGSGAATATMPPGDTSGLGGSATSMGASYAGSEAEGAVRRMAQKAHEAVDKLEQSIGSGSERVMDWQQEYGDMAREQVRSNPLAALGIAFGVGILFSKLFMR